MQIRKDSLLLVWFVMLLCLQGQEQQFDAKKIIENCIQSHGGAKKFQEISDIYAKLRIQSTTKDGVFESSLHEYFRKPDKIRMEIEPANDNSSQTIISWDGQNVYRKVKDKLEKSEDPKMIEQIQESIRFIRLMILTNLSKEGTIQYEKYLADKNVHIISETDPAGEKIWLWISGKNYVLLGAKFNFKGDKIPVNVIFVKHHSFDGMLLPQHTKMFRENSLIMEAWLSLARTNVLENRDEFFSDLTQKARLKVASTYTQDRRGSR